ncbi:MAG: hypothetical protein LUE90_06455 [Clostridiales bacterium]|nr:hypothetical protein [Clostridiales bacterium]
MSEKAALAVTDEAVLENAGQANIYCLGELTQSGGTVQSGYDNVYLAGEGSFLWESGNNKESVNYGICVEEDAYLKTTSGDAVMRDAGTHGIYLLGEADIDDILLIMSGANQIDVGTTGVLNLNGGDLAYANGNSVNNAGTMVMDGASIYNSGYAGIVNTGTLDMVSGKVFNNGDKGVINKNGGTLTILSEDVDISNNASGVINEENATCEIANAKIHSNTSNNVINYGDLYVHDVTMYDSGSNCVNCNYGGYALLENVVIDGTSSNHGIYNYGFSTVELQNVEIANTAKRGIQNYNAYVTGSNVTFTNIGTCAIASMAHTRYGGGDITLSDMTTDGVGTNSVYLDKDGAGTVTITGGTFGPATQNNVSIKAGTAYLTDVDIQGNTAEADDTNHGVYMVDGELYMKSCSVTGTTGSAIRNNGGYAEIKNLSVGNIAVHNVFASAGTTIVKNSKLAASDYHHVYTKGGVVKLTNCTLAEGVTSCVSAKDGSVTVTNCTLGATSANNINITGGSVTITESKVLGNLADCSESTHGVYLTAGSLKLSDTLISNTTGSAIRNNGGTVTADNLSVSDITVHNVFASDGTTTIKNSDLAASGYHHVYCKGGTVMLSNDTLEEGVVSCLSVPDTGVVNATNCSFGSTTGNNVTVTGGNVTLTSVNVLGNVAGSSDSTHGIYTTAGSVTMNGCTVSNTTGSAIRNNGGTVTADNLKVKNIEVHNVFTSGGTTTVKNSDLAASGYHHVYCKGGTVTLSNDTLEEGVASCLSVPDSGVVNATNCSFGSTTGNNVTVTGGSVTLTSVNVLGNVAGSSESTHGVYTTAGSVTMNKCSVKNTGGSAIRNAGGTVTADSLSVENIGEHNIFASDGTTTVKNSDLAASGYHHVYCRGGSVTLSNDTLEEGVVSCLSVPSGGTVTAEDCTFGQTTANNVTVTGGTVDLDDVEILGNSGDSADIHGVYVTAGTASLTDCTVQDANGQAVYSNGADASITINNLAVSNIGKHIIYLKDGKVVASGITLGENCLTDTNRNVLRSEGENAYAEIGDSVLTAGTGNTLIRNEAGTVVLQSGLELYGVNRAVYNSGTMVMNGGSIHNNGNGSSDSSVGNGNSASDGVGGGTAIYNIGDLTINGGSIYNNYTRSTGAVNNYTESASAGTITINGGSFYNNVNVKNGGALYVAEGTEAYVYGGYFYNNTAGTGQDICNEGTMTIGEDLMVGYDAAGNGYTNYTTGAVNNLTAATLSSDYVTISAEDGYTTMQGACSDGTYAYLLMQNADTNYCRLYKYKISDWSLVGSGDIKVYHGNGITYNSITGQLIVAHNVGDYTGISFVDPDSLAVTGTQKLSWNICSLTYDASGNRYALSVSTSSSTHVIRILDESFNQTAYITYTQPSDTYGVDASRQNIACDSNYIYMTYTSSTSGNVELILVFDWNGNRIGDFRVSSTMENEAMFCDASGQWYMTFYPGSKNGGRIYKLTMNMSALTTNVNSSAHEYNGDLYTTSLLTYTGSTSGHSQAKPLVITLSSGMSAIGTNIVQFDSTSAAAALGGGFAVPSYTAVVSGKYLVLGEEDSSAVATIGNTTFYRLEDALESAIEEYDGNAVTITILADYELSEAVTIPSGYSIILTTDTSDTASYTISRGDVQGAMINVESGASLVLGSADANDNSGSLILDNEGSENSVLNIEEGASATIYKNVTLSNTGSNNGVTVSVSGTLTIGDGAALNIAALQVTATGSINFAGTLADGSSITLDMDTADITDGMTIFTSGSKADMTANLAYIQLSEELTKAGYNLVQSGSTAYLTTNVIYVAQIGTTKYETLAAAVAAASNGDTIEIIASFALGETVTIPPGLDITITDDGSYRMIYRSTSFTDIMFKVYGSLTLTSTGDDDSPKLVLDGNRDSATAGSNSRLARVYSGGSVISEAGVVIQNHQVTDRSAVFDANGGVVTITGGLFQNNDAKWAAISQLATAGSSITVSGGTFENNTQTGSGNGGLFRINANGTFEISGGTFENNSSAGNGGIINVTSNGTGDIAISGATFSNNSSASYGGVIYLDGTGTVTLNGNTFEDNGDYDVCMNSADQTLKLTGKSEFALYFKDNFTSGNVIAVEGFDAGSSITMTWDSGLVSNLSAGDTVVTLDKNLIAGGTSASTCLNSFESELSAYELAVGNDGTGSDDGTLVLKERPVAKVGGTLYMTLAEAVTAASDGDTIEIVADITMYSGDTVTVDKNITITDDGTARTIRRASSLTSNMFVVEGGVLTIESTGTDSDPKLIFDGNSGGGSDTRLAKVNSGELVINAGVEVTNFTVADTSNSAVVQPNGGDLTINGGVFTENGGAPGAVANINNAASTITVTGGTFSGNYVPESKDDGGGVFRLGAAGKIIISGGTFTENSAKYGGVIRFNSAGTVEISGGTFSNNTASTSGGVVQFKGSISGASLTISGGTFTENSATSGVGGVIYNNSDGTSVTISEGTFSNNSAKTTGGVIDNAAKGAVTISGGTFSGNTAGTNAGVVRIAAVASSLSISGATFENNEASGEGGVIFINAAVKNATISDCTFTGNKGTHGSAVRVGASASTITISGCTFSGNETTLGGSGTDRCGAVHLNGTGTVTLNGNTFADNENFDVCMTNASQKLELTGKSEFTLFFRANFTAGNVTAIDGFDTGSNIMLTWNSMPSTGVTVITCTDSTQASSIAGCFTVGDGTSYHLEASGSNLILASGSISGLSAASVSGVMPENSGLAATAAEPVEATGTNGSEAVEAEEEQSEKGGTEE